MNCSLWDWMNQYYFYYLIDYMLEIFLVASNVMAYLNTPVEKLVHNWYSSESHIQEYVDYAYQKWWIEFVKLIECENGRRDPFRVSDTSDYWICQLNYRYNKKFINSPEFKDVYKQIDYCYEKYTYNPKLWYWPDRKIKWQKCSDYVSNRFKVEVIVPIDLILNN